MIPCFYFHESVSDFSCWKYPQELQLLHLKTSYHLDRVFGQKFTRNAKNRFECLKLIWSGTFAIFNTEPLWFWSRIGSRVKISHYIQPSNLSSALVYRWWPMSILHLALGMLLILCQHFFPQYLTPSSLIKSDIIYERPLNTLCFALVGWLHYKFSLFCQMHFLSRIAQYLKLYKQFKVSQKILGLM